MVIKYPNTVRRRHNTTPHKLADEVVVPSTEEDIPTLMLKGIRGMTGGQQHVENDDSLRRGNEVLGKDETERPHLGENLTTSQSVVADDLLVVKKPHNKRNSPINKKGNEFKKEKDTGKPIVEAGGVGMSVNVSAQNPAGDVTVSEDVVETPPPSGRKTVNYSTRQNFTQPTDQLPQTFGPGGSGNGQQPTNIIQTSTPPLTEFNRVKVIRKVHAIARRLYGEIPMKDEDEIIPSYIYYTRKLCFKLFGKKKRRELTDTEWVELLNHLETLYSTYNFYKHQPMSNLNNHGNEITEIPSP